MYDHTGKPIRMGAILGKGGEGAVAEIVGHPDQVVKLYHGKVDQKKAQKIEYMVSCQNDSLSKIACWPKGLVYETPNQKALKGFIMPKVVGFEEIHTLYGPMHRKKKFPTADWKFLLRVAVNCAAAFAQIHQHGHVIGDVNQGNILVSKDGIIKLIDCDSFQVGNPNDGYLCAVGVPLFTPPELQGKPFHGVIRTANHDNFGLAAIIFHLLFMGRHPFAGRYLLPQSIDIAIEKAIENHQFAFSSRARSYQMEPPRNSLTLSQFPRALSNLFEKAFEPNNKRPEAAEWFSSLRAAESSVVACSKVSVHKFFDHAKCPWCAFELNQLIFFVDPTAILVTDKDWFNIQFSYVPPQITIPPSLTFSSFPPLSDYSFPTVFTWLIALLKTKERRALFSMFCFAFCFFTSPFLMPFWLILTMIFIQIDFDCFFELDKIEFEMSDLKKQWNTLSNDNEELKSKKQTKKHYDDIKNIYNSYLELTSYYVLQVGQTQEKRRNDQQNEYLSNFSIQDAKLEGIGTALKNKLSSYGIETAKDVVAQDIADVPGFKEKRINTLLNWRHSLEKNFVFDSKRPIHPKEIEKYKEIEQRKRLYENQLRNIVNDFNHAVQLLASDHQQLSSRFEILKKAVSKKQTEETATFKKSSHSFWATVLALCCMFACQIVAVVYRDWGAKTQVVPKDRQQINLESLSSQKNSPDLTGKEAQTIRKIARQVRLKLSTRPSRADIYIEGMRSSQKTPLTIEAEQGKQLVIVAQKKGYRPKTWVWRAEKDQTETLRLFKVPPHSRKKTPISLKGTVRLLLRTKPTGALVLVSGKRITQKTPLYLRSQKGQRLIISVEKKGYMTASWIWKAQSDQKKQIALSPYGSPSSTAVVGSRSAKRKGTSVRVTKPSTSRSRTQPKKKQILCAWRHCLRLDARKQRCVSICDRRTKCDGEGRCLVGTEKCEKERCFRYDIKQKRCVSRCKSWQTCFKNRCIRKR